jgi:hypothetical protein
VAGYRTEIYCISCEVRTEFICYVEESRPPLWSSGQSSWLQNGDVLCFLVRVPGYSCWLQNGDVFPVRYELNLYMLCRIK